MSDTGQPKTSNDRELWREREGDYTSDRVFITEDGGLGIDVGGLVHVRPVRVWHDFVDMGAEQQGYKRGRADAARRARQQADSYEASGKSSAAAGHVMAGNEYRTTASVMRGFAAELEIGQGEKP